MDQLHEELKQEIIDTLKLSDISPEEIDVDAPLINEGLGLDSIDILELLVLLEKKYDITVPDIIAGRHIFSSVRSMANYVKQTNANYHTPSQNPE